MRYVEFKVFTEGHRSAIKFRVHAPEGQKFTAAGVEMQARDYIAGLQEQFPLKRFKAIPTGRGKVNIVHEVGEA